jgi:hypothetical protein
MSEGLNDGLNLSRFLAVPRGAPLDPAKEVRERQSKIPHPNNAMCLFLFQGFTQKLKNYLLRWTSMPNPNITSYDHFTEEDRAHITIISNTLYRHKTLQLKYTTYDMLEGQDRIYQRRYPDIMVLSDDEEHPYMYGRVLDFFHVNVRNNGPDSLLPLASDAPMVQMAWVRWFKLDGPSGFHSLRYPSVSFYEGHDPDAFGFIHPDEIIRAVHLIPSFKAGQTTEYLDVLSRARPEVEGQDWQHFEVNMYVWKLPQHHTHTYTCHPGLDWWTVTCSCGFVEVASATGICDRLSPGWMVLDGAQHGHQLTAGFRTLSPPSKVMGAIRKVATMQWIQKRRVMMMTWNRQRRKVKGMTWNSLMMKRT